jgi:hypothetical protein
MFLEHLKISSVVCSNFVLKKCPGRPLVLKITPMLVGSAVERANAIEAPIQRRKGLHTREIENARYGEKGKSALRSMSVKLASCTRVLM